MKYENKTTTNDEQNRIIRFELTAETWEENKIIAKTMGMDINKTNYVECVINLKNNDEG